jgi:hypothetical protein
MKEFYFILKHMMHAVVTAHPKILVVKTIMIYNLDLLSRKTPTLISVADTACLNKARSTNAVVLDVYVRDVTRAGIY